MFPHSLAYFNELVGGPTGGHAHLLGSNVDWGQDLLFLKRWLDKHPEASPLALAHTCYYDAHVAGIEFSALPAAPGEVGPSHGPSAERIGPRPGWYAVSVNEIRSRRQEHAYFLKLEPVAMAGYSIYIYHVPPDDANRLRRELGLLRLECAQME